MLGANKFRFCLGISLLVLGLIMPLFGLLVLRTEWSAGLKATIVGLLTAGGPEIVAILAAAVLGKKNFEIIKSRIFLALKTLRPTARVGKVRYTIGLIMFLLPIIPTYVMAYVPQWLPDTSPARLYVNIGADCVFVTSLFVLGGDFWDKLTALFVYESHAQFDERPVA